MILFWVICALLLVIALAFVLPPLLQRSAESERKIEDERKQANIAVYRDQLSELEADLQNGIVSQEQYAQDRDEIERRLLEDVATAGKPKSKPVTTSDVAKITAYALGIGLPLVAISFYAIVGSPKSITNAAAATASNDTTGPAPTERTQEQIEANVGKLAERLKSNPSDAKGWAMLARSYSSMDRYADAVNAYAKATELTPNDADLWAEYAFATAMTNGRSLEGKPMDLIDRALKIDPNSAKALQLAGTAAFQAKDYKKAVDYWQRVLKQVPPNSDVAQTITSRIDEAKRLAAGK
ncbi:MAG TPA: c-type cytochrome biogenesis protein CcmI [Pyrinomonadaceae bacterium]|nr:c-type cytochrome biogenesis protein CcmI [Pyrinomonadaceae bacterium]